MGLLDALLGRTKPIRANLDALFALPSAAITLQTAAGLVLSGRAGVCWKPPAGQQAADVQREIGELLDIPDDAGMGGPGGTRGLTGAGSPGGPGQGRPAPSIGTLTQAEDAYGYRWLMLDDPDVEDLVTRVHMVNTTLTENGWGPQLLCSVFGVVPAPDAGRDARPLYLVYLYKRGTFYPFAPIGRERRDSELELRARAVLADDLPFEQDLSRWFPLWDLPVR
ncbi:MAG: PspA-associated protein PspAB [Acidimicrobiales bacterium]